MAYDLSERRVPLQQTLHGYSEGHRLLASSIDLPPRDAKTLLMMSDASGPAATIGPKGYLTGYPLAESGHYALARTWPAPEMPRPGCVWTHTILVDFSDIPSLARVDGLMDLFRRPKSAENLYKRGLDFIPSDKSERPGIPTDLARRILSGLYGAPGKAIVSAAGEGPARDALVLAVWSQQWPRLRRAFRFCTLSFADRSSPNAMFDLQFLPAAGRVKSTQFKGAVDAERRDFVASDWLENAVTDLSCGSHGSLRLFLRAAGSDVGGREAFQPLATLHALSKHFDSDPTAIERAISLLERTITPDQGNAARTFLVKTAAAVAERLSPDGIKFVARNLDLIDAADIDAVAKDFGRAFWRIDPKALLDMRFEAARHAIAERAIAALPPASLLEGARSMPAQLTTLVEARPDIVIDPTFWLLEGSTKPDILKLVGTHSDLADEAIDAMIRSGRPLAREAQSIFGSDRVLRRLLVDSNRAGSSKEIRRGWLPAAISDGDAVARVLAEDWLDDSQTLEAIARATTPDSVPNAYGEDPWLTAVKRLSTRTMGQYLASFLLARALGRHTKNSVDLTRATFDLVHNAVEKGSLSHDAWAILDLRLDRPSWWQEWDRCLRIRNSVVSVYFDRSIDPLEFVKISDRDEVFAALIENLSEKFGGRRYLREMLGRMEDNGIRGSRFKIVKKAL